MSFPRPLPSTRQVQWLKCPANPADAALESYVKDLGWTLNASTGVIAVPPNPDNQIKATVTRESIALPRKFKAAHASSVD